MMCIRPSISLLIDTQLHRSKNQGVLLCDLYIPCFVVNYSVPVPDKLERTTTNGLVTSDHDMAHLMPQINLDI